LSLQDLSEHIYFCMKNLSSSGAFVKKVSKITCGNSPCKKNEQGGDTLLVTGTSLRRRAKRVDFPLPSPPSYRPCTWHCLEKRRRRFEAPQQHTASPNRPTICRPYYVSIKLVCVQFVLQAVVEVMKFILYAQYGPICRIECFARERTG
jgi:hypothetical protein